VPRSKCDRGRCPRLLSMISAGSRTWRELETLGDVHDFGESASFRDEIKPVWLYLRSSASSNAPAFSCSSTYLRKSVIL
jgi:hypothetical protein